MRHVVVLKLYMKDVVLLTDFEYDFDVDFECDVDNLDAYFERTSV